MTPFMLRWLLLFPVSPLWLLWRLVRAVIYRVVRPRTLLLHLSGSLPDMPSGGGLIGLLRGRRSSASLLATLEALEAANQDAALRCVLVVLSDLKCGLSRAEDIRAALKRLRDNGKHVVVYADELGVVPYWVALGASRIVMSPGGALNITGIGSEFTLLKGFLDKVGVKAQFAARGKYKSMREMFTAEEISEENREMLESIVGELSEQLTARIAADRDQVASEVAKVFAEGPFRAERAKEYKLIDDIRYLDEVRDDLKEQFGSRCLRAAPYLKRRKARSFFPTRETPVALLRVTGNIVSGTSQQGTSGPRSTGADTFRAEVRRVAKDDAIKAVVLRVDSPGGSALASDLMWRELSRLASKKKVYVSMANMAASGGYYVSGLKGVTVWAAPMTLTGSIGVVGGKFVISELLAKLGIRRAQVGSGPRSHYYSDSHEWSADELERFTDDIDASYRDFVQKMADARECKFEELEAFAQGRVWTGRQALEHKLVDRIGGIHELSLTLRKDLGIGVKRALVWRTYAPKGSALFGRAQESDLLDSLEPILPELAESLSQLRALGTERMFCLAPFSLRR